MGFVVFNLMYRLIKKVVVMLLRRLGVRQFTLEEARPLISGMLGRRHYGAAPNNNNNNNNDDDAAAGEETFEQEEVGEVAEEEEQLAQPPEAPFEEIPLVPILRLR